MALVKVNSKQNDTPSLDAYGTFENEPYALDNQPYESPYATGVEIPKFRIPQKGSSADTVAQLIRDELDLDCRPSLNLARHFVGTYMEPEAVQIMVENLSKNMSDFAEYPSLMQMHERCVSMIANMWNVQPGDTAVGAATTGSSEAIHLGGLAMKRRWQEDRRAKGKDASKPNIIMASNAQVALHKFARYFDVEERVLPVTSDTDYCLDPKLIRNNVDENTIGVFVILGSTYTGHYEPVEAISKVLDEVEQESGFDIPIHVDAASGGFVATFARAGAGGAQWDFKLPRVKSINTSGHKFGLVYAGLGWIVWRDEKFLPKDLIFEIDYLGASQETFTLSFSRPGAQVIAQYFNLVRLGFNGYQRIMEQCLWNARVLSRNLESTGFYTCVSNIHRYTCKQYAQEESQESRGPFDQEVPPKSTQQETSADFCAGLPVVAFGFSEHFLRNYPAIKLSEISRFLRAQGYLVPCYPLPHSDGEEQKMILRVVVRESMSLSLVNQLFVQICEATKFVLDTARPVSVPDIPCIHQEGKGQPELSDWHMIES